MAIEQNFNKQEKANQLCKQQQERRHLHYSQVRWKISRGLSLSIYELRQLQSSKTICYQSGIWLESKVWHLRRVRCTFQKLVRYLAMLKNRTKEQEHVYELNNVPRKICCLVIDIKGKTREGVKELDLTKKLRLKPTYVAFLTTRTKNGWKSSLGAIRRQLSCTENHELHAKNNALLVASTILGTGHSPVTQTHPVTVSPYNCSMCYR